MKQRVVIDAMLSSAFSSVLGMSMLLQVDALSELFIAWDDILAETENKVTKLGRDCEER